MKFDPNKPHGVVVNHPWIRYEQGGHFFGQDGKSIGEPEVIPDKLPAPEPLQINNSDHIFGVANARAFLTNILADGALARSVVFNESNANNQEWDNVKTAFAEMGGETLKRKSVTYWKLKTE